MLVPVFSIQKKPGEDAQFFGKRVKMKIVFRVCSAARGYRGSAPAEQHKWQRRALELHSASQH